MGCYSPGQSSGEYGVFVAVRLKLQLSSSSLASKVLNHSCLTPLSTHTTAYISVGTHHQQAAQALFGTDVAS